MPQNAAVSFVAGDGNVGGGYGTLRIPMAGGDSQAELAWPYRHLTDLEAEPIDDELDGSRKVVRTSDAISVDSINQQNYRPHAFVKSATRGLTGIMAGKRPDLSLRQVLEVGLSGPLGSAGKSFQQMGSFDARIAPGKKGGVGSDKGWSKAPPPKPSDPEEPAYTLRDIGEEDPEKPVKRARNQKNIATNGQKHLLNDYVRMCITHS